MNTFNIAICGAGALGSNIVHNLAREGVKFFIIDDDKIEPSNITVSVYRNADVAKEKADVLAGIARERGSEAVAVKGTLTTQDVLREMDIDLIVDTFDNPDARALTMGAHVPTVHVGVGEEGNGIVYWDEVYQLPPKDKHFKRGDNPVCTNALGARLIRRTALAASEIIDNYIRDESERESVLVTEKGEIG